MTKKLNLTNQKFNSLLVLKEALPIVSLIGRKDTAWECLCDCGEIAIIRTGSLRSGNSKTCGCSHLKNTTHGKSKDPFYRRWRSMLYRCYGVRGESYKHYGGRGIKVCKEWHNLNNFTKWCLGNGYKKGLSIDRINNDDDYKPSNCRFVTLRVNNLNQRHLQKNNISGYRGVQYIPHAKKWRSGITVKGKVYSFGYFDSPNEAIIPRNKFIKEHQLEQEYKIQEETV